MKHDPSAWPLAPGNAPERYEAAFAKQAAAWKVPLDQSQYDVVRGALSRVRTLAS